MNTSIKVGFCIAYDWHLLKYSLPIVYGSSDVICLSIDKNRVSWANNQYSFDESGFFNLVRDIDTYNKIIIYEDDFHIHELSPMENEVRQRKMMSKKMQEGGWHIQLDCDEYFINFNKFVSYLKSLSGFNSLKVNICCSWITLFKQINNGFLFIAPKKRSQLEFIQVATNFPDYEYGRRSTNYNVFTNFQIIHHSWARSESEIQDKLNNWGHKNDFSAHQYLEFWNSLNKDNYKTFSNFHPIHSEVWPALGYSECYTVDELIQKFSTLNVYSPSSFDLKIRKSQIIARIKDILRL